MKDLLFVIAGSLIFAAMVYVRVNKYEIQRKCWRWKVERNRRRMIK